MATKLELYVNRNDSLFQAVGADVKQIKLDIGVKGNLNTTAKSSTVEAINEVNSKFANYLLSNSLLDASGKLIPSVLPPVSISETFPVNSQAQMLALTAQKGDVAIRSDLNKTFILRGNSPSVLADWEEMLTPTSEVSSVHGRVGAVVAQESDYDAFFAKLAHTHSISDVANLQTVLNGKEASFTKKSAFNKNFGTASGTVAQGNDSRINNGQSAFDWGNHASAGYVTESKIIPWLTNIKSIKGSYIPGGAEKPNYFGGSKLKLQMLNAPQNLGISKTSKWNDVLWLSGYNGNDVKLSNALVFSKGGKPRIGFMQQNYDATSWGTYNEIYHSGNIDNITRDFVKKSATNLGKTGNQSNVTISTLQQYADLPIGWSGMINPNSIQLPTNNFVYFTKIANRDVEGGWSGIMIKRGNKKVWTVQTITNSSNLEYSELVTTSALVEYGYLKKNQVNTFTKQQATNVGVMTGTSTLTWDLDVAQKCKILLTRDVTIQNPLNMRNGSTYVLAIKQDGTGNRRVSWGTAFEFGDDGVPILSKSAGKTDFLVFECYGSKMFFIGVKTGFSNYP